MRYLIESVSDEAGTIGAQIARWEKDGKISLLEKGDPIEEIKKDLLRIRRAFETLDKLGINEEILVAYIKSKGVSVANINSVLHHQKRFF